MAQDAQPSTNLTSVSQYLWDTLTDTSKVLGSLYVYAPNKGAPIFFTIAYAISAVFHLWQC